ncbi:bifunctional tetrahydrofolate synthase/dihydrofolate synthase [Methylibium sp.]|jgi:dihydrofolate synthase/folylpolyglutamate synthase|uniref:bifunctional tetrahydrofolate synthase/dihydrofolate synthase n=1 Tax=Methylibium sp. TaxID=2067992 RepID=UPI003BAB525E
MLAPLRADAAPALRVRRPRQDADLAAWLAHADALHAQTIDMGLERVVKVRDALGLKPGFPLITVAGTNGKGSTCALLASVLDAAGYRVGVYSSPHLLRYNERVRIDGAPVGDAALCAAYARVEGARGHTPLTPFEFGTLAAMCVFAEADLDAAVLEVGLGGRLDAVNAFDADCAIVTSIGIDHVDYLGPTRESIAVEKSGVFRAGRPAICADPEPPVTIAQEARRLGARLLQSGRDYRVRRDPGDTWTLIRRSGELTGLPLPALAGDVQLHNAGACLMALETLARILPVDAAQIHRGLQQVQLIGRFQRWRRHPGAPEVLLDVAHNPHAAQRLAVTLAQHPVRGRTLAVFAMLRDKDIAGTAQALRDGVDAWFVAGIAERRGASAADMAAALDAAQVQRTVHLCASPLDAYRDAVAAAGPDDRVLVCGSFSTVAAVLRELEAEATAGG